MQAIKSSLLLVWPYSNFRQRTPCYTYLCMLSPDVQSASISHHSLYTLDPRVMSPLVGPRKHTLRDSPKLCQVHVIDIQISDVSDEISGVNGVWFIINNQRRARTELNFHMKFCLSIFSQNEIFPLPSPMSSVWWSLSHAHRRHTGLVTCRRAEGIEETAACMTLYMALKRCEKITRQ